MQPSAVEHIEQIRNSRSEPPQGQRSCQHILATGRRCGSPALRREKFCY